MVESACRKCKNLKCVFGHSAMVWIEAGLHNQSESYFLVNSGYFW